MEDSKFYDLCQKFLDQMHTTTSDIQKLLSNHEARLTVLETTEKKHSVIDSDMVKWLIKAIVTAITVIGGLTGVVKMSGLDGTAPERASEVQKR